MSVLSNFRIGTRLIIAFSLLVALMLAMVLVARQSLAAISDDIHFLISDRYAKVKLVNQIDDELNLQARLARNLLIMDNAADRAGEIQSMAKSRATTGELYARLQPTVTTEKGKALLSTVLDERRRFLATMDQFLQSVQANDLAGAKTLLLTGLRPQQLSYMKTLSELIVYQEQLMDASGQEASDRVARSSMLLIVSALVGLVVAAIAAVSVTRSVVLPLQRTVGTLTSIAGGDLTQDVAVDRTDEVGQQQRALSDMVHSLRRLVTQVHAGIESVTTASGQIAAGNQDLSSRTEQQASSLQETASSMEQLTSTVKSSADHAQEASRLATEASLAAERGGETVGAVVDTMQAITESSRRIADIIGVIDGIAFQTNILALNAAVEAARAGEQGRGFAVVASEVRTLAQRSAEAAKEIKALIGSSVDKVEAGSRQVGDAGAAMEEIVSRVRSVAGLIESIASAANEQSAGIQQVNQAVSQMDQVTQQNAALVEEGAAAAASLADQANALSRAIGAFQLA